MSTPQSDDSSEKQSSHQNPVNVMIMYDEDGTQQWRSKVETKVKLIDTDASDPALSVLKKQTWNDDAYTLKDICPYLGRHPEGHRLRLYFPKTEYDCTRGFEKLQSINGRGEKRWIGWKRLYSDLKSLCLKAGFKIAISRSSKSYVTVACSRSTCYAKPKLTEEAAETFKKKQKRYCTTNRALSEDQRCNFHINLLFDEYGFFISCEKSCCYHRFHNHGEKGDAIPTHPLEDHLDQHRTDTRTKVALLSPNPAQPY